MSELTNALSDYLAAVIATKQREAEAKAIKGLNAQDHEMIERGFRRAKEIEQAMDDMRSKHRLRCVDGVWYVGDELKDNTSKVLHGRTKSKVKGTEPTKPKVQNNSRHVPSANALAAAEIFACLFDDG